jgi:hypothetical protein
LGRRSRPRSGEAHGWAEQNHCDDALPFGCPALLGAKRGRQRISRRTP